MKGAARCCWARPRTTTPPARIGPFIRLFDDKFTIDDVRKAVVELEIVGTDNYRLEGKSTMAEISRDPLDLVKQTISEHQYPDGFALFLGTLFAPTQDRDVKGSRLHPQGRRCGADFHPQAGRAGEPGHHLQGRAALEFRYFRPDEKPCPAWAFERLVGCGPATYTPMTALGCSSGVGLGVANPLNTRRAHFSPILPRRDLMTETLTHFIGGKQISAPGALESLNPSNTGEVDRQVSRMAAPKT